MMFVLRKTMEAAVASERERLLADIKLAPGVTHSAVVGVYARDGGFALTSSHGHHSPEEAVGAAIIVAESAYPGSAIGPRLTMTAIAVELETDGEQS